MDLQDKRMQCLRMAAELGGNVDAVIAAAQRMFDFVKGAEPAALVDSPAADISPEPIAVAEPKAEVATAQAGAIAEAATSELLVADPIAACGTALVMPESGSLAEAVLSPEAVTAAEAPAVITVDEVPVKVAAEEAPAEAVAAEAPAEVTAEEAPAEAVAAEAPAEVTAEEAPAEAVAAEAPAEVTAEEAPAEAVAAEAPAEVTAEEAPAEAVAAEAPAEVTAEEAPAEAVAAEAPAEVAAEEADTPATNPAFLVPVPPASLTDLAGEQPASHA
jgi:ribonuclease E